MSAKLNFRATALVVDDEPDLLELLSLTLARMEIACVTAATLDDAYKLLKSRQFQLCLTDMRLPDGNGLDLIQEINHNYPQLPVAMITAHGNMDSAITALKAGAFDFVNKPVNLHTLRELVNNALKLHQQQSDRSFTTPQLLGDSATIVQLRKTIDKLSRSQAPIFISGESGTGKELVARLIHQHGPRAGAPFVPVNCGAIPAELIESELFGHTRGAFTGAQSERSGLFQAAHGGTLFLDEVADLPLAMQVKLLRAIQERKIRPVGAEQEIAVDVRLLSATHQDLAQMVKQGSFREDLYFRIHVIELKVPALRDHPDDIPLLCQAIISRLGAAMEIRLPQISSKTLQLLANYPFPGNVRELENILERALTLCEGNSITPEDIQLSDSFEQPQSRTDNGHTPEDQALAEEIGIDNYLADIERNLLLETLERCRYNKTAAAKRLGITFRSFRYRLQRLGIEE
ncbi:MAG: sigma-54-dependent Fis family transcriptional regulator [Gammaproteobacteria bacterium]|nr:sigma-54-dependent Fis family transcriptional regulator [Gammaproteobacteria bacterium]